MKTEPYAEVFAHENYSTVNVLCSGLKVCAFQPFMNFSVYSYGNGMGNQSKEKTVSNSSCLYLKGITSGRHNESIRWTCLNLNSADNFPCTYLIDGGVVDGATIAIKRLKIKM